MARKSKVQFKDIAEMQPDEISALKKVAKEFITRMENIENEIALLRDDKKQLTDEYRSKLDTKTLKAVLQVLKIKNAVERKHTFDLLEEALSDPGEA